MTPDLITHVRTIDEQNEELFFRLSALTALWAHSVTREETEKALDLLNNYINKHFADEEALQLLSAYPQYEQHRGLHKSFIAEFQILREEYKRNGFSAMFAFKLNRSIIDWLVKHIRTVDVEFGKFMNKNRTPS